MHAAPSARHHGIHAQSHRGHKIAEVVTVSDIGRHNRLALRVFASNQVARALRPNVSNLAQSHNSAADATQLQIHDLLDAFAFTLRKSHDNVVAPHTFADFRNTLAIERLLHLLGRRCRREPHCRKILRAIANRKRGTHHFTIGGNIARAFDREQFAFDFFRDTSKCGEIIAVHADRNCSRRARENVRQAVFNRLTDHGGHARNVCNHAINRSTHFFLIGTRVHRDFDFRTAHWLRVFIAFGATCAARDALNSIDLRELTFHTRSESIALNK